MIERGEGERRLRTRRRAFWGLVAAGIALGIGMGFVMGLVGGIGRNQPVSPLIVWPLVGATVALFAWYSAVYLRKIDELDLQDNLWASLIALYFYVVAFPVWYFLHDLNHAPPVMHWAIYIATFVVMLAAYGWRKLR